MTLRRSENEFVGVGSGLLDQFSSLFGRADHALFLDCGTLVHDRLPLGDPAPAIVVCDSKTSRRLADGMYDRRRAECERIVDVFRRPDPASRRVPCSRGCRSSSSTADWDALDPVGRKRARHVLSENERVRQGVEALEGGRCRGLRPADVGLARLQPRRLREQLAGARRPDRGGRGRPRLPGRQALGRRLGRLHGQPRPGRPRRRLRRVRPDAATPGGPGSRPRSTSATPPTGPSARTSPGTNVETSRVGTGPVRTTRPRGGSRCPGPSCLRTSSSSSTLRTSASSSSGWC